LYPWRTTASTRIFPRIYCLSLFPRTSFPLSRSAKVPKPFFPPPFGCWVLR